VQWEHRSHGILTKLIREGYCGPVSKVVQGVNSAKVGSHVLVLHVVIDWVSICWNRLGREFRMLELGSKLICLNKENIFGFAQANVLE